MFKITLNIQPFSPRLNNRMFSGVRIKRFLLLAALVAAGVGMALAVEGPNQTFYLQLVHGSNSEQPPTPQAKKIGPRLGQKLHAVFQWKAYWEVKRATVTVASGGKARTRLTADREVELRLVGDKQMEIQVFHNGKPMRSERQAATTPFWIVGGNAGEHQCWFIVVRQDRPPPLNN